VCNLAFAIPDLIYAYQGSECVTVIPEGFSFGMATWLAVDGYLRLAVIGMVLLVLGVNFISSSVGEKLAKFGVLLFILYSLFSLSWLIVGSVMYWGKLNPAGVCYGPVQSYIYSLLVISYVSIFCNCLTSFNSNR
jgi:hypothetical protein